jgi:uncharacterized membrane protein YgcG
MKCRYCHKNVKNIGHFMRAHKALMLRKMRKGRGGGRRSSGRKTSHESFRSGGRVHHIYIHT